MAMNPMQRKANNYLLIGVLVTLLITGSIIAFLFYQLNTLQKEKQARESSLKQVYVIATDIASGEAVTLDKLQTQSVEGSLVPANALTIDNITENTIAKIDLSQGTVITDTMVTESDNQTTDDLRIQEYNMILLPSQINTGDYIDVRLRLPNGTDYLVVSKKEVDIPQINGVDSANTIRIKMSEADTLVMSNAIVEAYIMKGSVLYATTYVEPGMQGAATATYVPNAVTQDAIYRDPNIVQEAKAALINMYNSNSSIRTNVIDGALSGYQENSSDNIDEAIQEELNRAQEERQSYLESLGATF